ncbi:MAG TPA: hypothetical protein VM915_09760 [Verrucomicrobiae bacterium]|jgi:hypothetical protein|nr:hypothetical protein [Verrucomicrobiae bacterium]
MDTPNFDELLARAEAETTAFRAADAMNPTVAFLMRTMYALGIQHATARVATEEDDACMAAIVLGLEASIKLEGYKAESARILAAQKKRNEQGASEREGQA